MRRDRVKCVSRWPMDRTDSGYLITVNRGLPFLVARQPDSLDVGIWGPELDPCMYSHCLPIRRANVPQIADYCRLSRLASTLSIEADLV